MNLRLILASTAVAVGASTCTVAPAAADIPSNVTDGRHGSVDAGWVRAACAVNAGAAKCALRFPEGVRRLEVDYRLGGLPFGTLAEWDRDVAPRVRDRIRRTRAHVAPGVDLRCMTVGAIVDCDLELAGRFNDFNVSTFSAGVMLGGLKWEGDES